MLINEMASAIAHEINQPLSAIRNYCRTIQRLLPHTTISSERLSNLVASAVEQVDVASEIINDTRRFVKREVPTAAQSSVGECVALCFRLLQQEIDKGRIQVQTKLSPNLQAGIPPVKLQQVILNLLRNSIEAMAGQELRQIEVSARSRNDGQVVFRVKDTGEGMSEETQADLFKPFATTKEHGLGLGLSLSRTIVNEYGGQLWCEKSAPGSTSICFTVREFSKS
jgi:two-component system sensor kinase FixL